ncbi:MAG: Na+/H+ antiporter NhaA [Alphaproteobacteria bacterium]|nr:Na+/H+ antiporter NhaA [Alphaproteobacteria bacterium SS10]
MSDSSIPNPLRFIKDFLKTEAAGGIILMITAAVALIISNSPASGLYLGLLDTKITFAIAGLVNIDKPLLLWINDGLMAIFFLLVGLEIKRELLVGELSSWKKSSLPVFTAIGGMAIPALFYVAVNWGNPDTINGWAIPAATDIAFALGILALLGTRAPASLKIFLLALAILDDLGAITIIAVFYTADVKMQALYVAGAALAVLATMNLAGVKRLTPYMLIGLILWTAVLKSGVHATLAGVALAFCIPLKCKTDVDTDAITKHSSPLEVLEHSLHYFVAFAVLPIFAFANAGVSLAGLQPSALLEPVPLGILLGLFFGKQVGVVGFGYIAIKAKIANLPDGVNWAQFYGVSMLAGIGFTMSLFIGNLAFADPALATDVRLGVLAGSILSAVCGYSLLRWAGSPKRMKPAEDAGVQDGGSTAKEVPAQ